MPEFPEQSESVSSETTAWSWLRKDRAAPITGFLAKVGVVLVVLEMIIAVWLRFSTTSLLWLDEALTVNIAKLPLGSIPGALKHDGAPPLYYVVLHFWMQAVGSSDFAVRSLPGIFSVATLAVTFFIVKRLFGLEVSTVSVAFLGACSYATYYATESRMYALVMLLVSLGIAAVAWLYESPSWQRGLLVAVIGSLLLYTHYWSIYLLAATGAWFVLSLLIGPDERVKKAGRLGVVSLIASGLSFLPWLPIFLFQSKHTGTPWTSTPQYRTAIMGVFHYFDNQGAQSPTGSVNSLLFAACALIAVLAVFAIAISNRFLELDLKGRKAGRTIAWFVFVTMMIGIVGAHASKSAFTPRYAAVVFIPFMVLLAVGTGVIKAPALRFGVVVILVLAMLSAANASRTTQRTQAGQISAVISAEARPGDWVAICPDQLGPSLLRVLPDNHYRIVSYPRFNSPGIINWVDYGTAIKSTSPKQFFSRVSAEVGQKNVWLVWSPGYGSFNQTCQILASKFLRSRGWNGRDWVKAAPRTYYQSMNLTQFVPPGAPASSGR